MKKHGTNYLFVRPHVDAIFWLTAFEVLNVATIWLLFEIEPVTGNANLDLAILSVLLFSLNAFLKLNKKRHEKIFSKYEQKSRDRLVWLGILTVLYAIVSAVGFYFVHSSI